MSKLLFLDLETTGINPELHGIVSISAITDILNQQPEAVDLRLKPFDGCSYDAQALEVINTTYEEIQAYQPETAVYAILLDFIEKKVNKYDKQDKFTVVGYNCMFDMAFLANLFKRNFNNYTYAYFNAYYVDLFAIVKLIHSIKPYPTENLKLATICKYYGISLDNAHNSFADIKATRELYYKIIPLIQGVL